MKTIEVFIVYMSLAIGFITGRKHYKKLRSGKTKEQKLAEWAKAHGYVIQARAVSSKYYYGIRDSNNAELRNPSISVSYEYTIDGKQYYIHLTYQNRGMVSIDYPVTVNVYYDPKNPLKAVCDANVNESRRVDKAMYKRNRKRHFNISNTILFT